MIIKLKHFSEKKTLLNTIMEILTFVISGRFLNKRDVDSDLSLHAN